MARSSLRSAIRVAAVSASVVAAVTGGARSARGADWVWTGAVGDGNWLTSANPSNWIRLDTGKTNAVIPGTGANTGATVFFASTLFDNVSGYAYNVSLPAGVGLTGPVTIGTLGFGGTDASGIYTLAQNLTVGTAGTTITLSGGITRIAGGTDNLTGGASNGQRYAATSGVQTIASNVVASASQTWAVDGNGQLQVAGTVGSAAGTTITKSKGGTLEIDADNSQTLLGAYVAQGGATVVGNNLALGTGTVQVSGTASSVTANASLLTNSGITFANNVTVALNPNNATVTLGGAGAQTSSTWTGAITIAQGVTITGGTAGFTDFRGAIGGTGNVSKQAAGTVQLSAANTFVGTFTGQGGTTVLNNPAALANATAVNVSGPTSGNPAALLTNTGVTLAQNVTVAANVNAAGTGGASLQRGATLGGSAGSTVSAWSGNIAINQPVNLTGGVAGTTTFSGALSDGVGDPAGTSYPFVGSSVTKVDAGTVILTGQNTYSGTTTVAAGTLRVNNGSSGARATTGSGAVIVGGAGVAAALGGTGQAGVGSAVVSVNDLGTITAGASATTTGTLTTGVQQWNSSTGTFLAKVIDTSNSDAGNDRLVLSGLTAVPGFTVALQALGSAAPTFAVANPARTDAAGGAAPLAGSYIVLATDTEGPATNPFASNALLDALQLRFDNAAGVASNGTVQLATLQTDGGLALIAEAVAAPEPTSLLLAAMVAGPLVLGRRRRRR